MGMGMPNTRGCPYHCDSGRPFFQGKALDKEPWDRGWDITMLEQFGWYACADMSPRSKVYRKSTKMADAVADDDVTLPRGNEKMFFLFGTFSAL